MTPTKLLIGQILMVLRSRCRRVVRVAVGGGAARLSGRVGTALAARKRCTGLSILGANWLVAFGQSRALVVWQRIVFPDGCSLRLANVPATDPAGYAGLADKVDFHTWALLKGAEISTLLGVGTNLTSTGESGLVQATASSPSKTSRAPAMSQPRATCGSSRRLPSVPGAPGRLVVHRDLVLAPQKD